MKWILLFLIISSCGKNETPKKFDFTDSDGDQILNSVDENKYVAEYESTYPIRGRIRFNNSGISEIPFSSERYLNNTILGMLSTRNYDDNLNNDEFDGWSNVKLLRSETLLKSDQDFYSVRLSFDTNHSESDEVGIMTNDKIYSLGFWEKNKKINLKKSELMSILSGKSFFSVKKNNTQKTALNSKLIESIKSKTYKVYFYDGIQNKILYISKNLTFNDFKKKMKIKSKDIQTGKELFFNVSDNRSRKWYSRQLSSYTYVLGYLDESDVFQSIVNSFSYTKVKIQRLNGIPKNNLKLNHKPGAFVFIRFKNIQQKSKEIKTNISEGKGKNFLGRKLSESCFSFIKRSLKEKSRPRNIKFLLKNIKNSDHFAKDIVENVDTNIVFWELSTDYLPENFTFSFKKSPNLTDNHYLNACLKPQGNFRTYQIESSLSVEIESFVEKI